MLDKFPPPGWPIFAAATCLLPPLAALAIALTITDRLLRRHPC
jgi:hypothetical protein